MKKLILLFILSPIIVFSQSYEDSIKETEQDLKALSTEQLRHICAKFIVETEKLFYINTKQLETIDSLQNISNTRLVLYKDLEKKWKDLLFDNTYLMIKVESLEKQVKVLKAKLD